MRLLILCPIMVLVLCVTCPVAFAQLYGSVSVATPLRPDDTQMGLSIAGGMAFSIGENLLLRSELSHSSFKRNREDRGGTARKKEIDLTLVDLHLLLVGAYTNNLRFYAGPSAGLAFTSTFEEGFWTTTSTDFAPTVGLTAGFNILFGREGTWGLMFETQLQNSFPVIWGDPSLSWTPIRVGLVL